MEINSFFNSGLQGIQEGLQSLQSNAHLVASTSVPQKNAHVSEYSAAIDFPSPPMSQSPLIYQIQAQHHISASMQVIQTADHVLGTMVSIQA